jgi:hypothetical protein
MYDLRIYVYKIQNCVFMQLIVRNCQFHSKQFEDCFLLPNDLQVHLGRERHC